MKPLAPRPLLPLSGRADVLEALADQIDGSGPVISIVGPAGCGKSHLFDHLLANCGDGQLDTVILRHDGDEWKYRADGPEGSALLDRLEEVDAPGDPTIWAPLDDAGVDVVGIDLHGEPRSEDFVSELRQWSGSAPQTTFVITSRTPLDLEEARRHPIAGLSNQAATELFEQRLTALSPAIDVDALPSSTVDNLCEQLDGFPRAIELAARDVSIMGPDRFVELLDRSGTWPADESSDTGQSPLNRRLPLVYPEDLDGLSATHRSVIETATVFEGAFDFEALSSLVADPSLTDRSLCAAIGELVDDGLLYVDPDSSGLGTRRFRLYGLCASRLFSQLDEETRTDLRRRHADYFATRAEVLAPKLRGPEGASVRRAFEAMAPDIRQAMEWSREADPRLFSRLVATLRISMPVVSVDELEAAVDEAIERVDDDEAPSSLYALRARVAARFQAGNEARRAWIDALEHHRDGDEPGRKADAHLAISEIDRRRGNLDAAAEEIEAVVEIADDADDDGLRRLACGYLVANTAERGDADTAREQLEQLQRLEPGDDLERECDLLQRAGYGCHYLGNITEQRRLYRRARECADQIGDRYRWAICNQSLGDNAYLDDRLEDAEARYLDALEIYRRHPNRYREAELLGNLATTRHRLGRLEDAYPLYIESLSLHRRNDARAYEAVVLFAVGALHQEHGQFDEADHHYEQAQTIYGELDLDFDAAATHLVAAWLEIDRQRHTRALEALELVEEALDRVDANPRSWRVPVALTRALVAGIDADTDTEKRQLDAAVAHIDETSWADGVAERIAARLWGVWGNRSAWSDRVETAIAGDFERLLPAIDDEVPPSLYERLVRRLDLRAVPEDAVADTDTDETGSVGADDAGSEDEPEPEDERDSREGDQLVVASDLRWFRVGSEPVVDISRRSSTRRVLDALVTQHLEDPTRQLGVSELFAVGWPDDDIRPDSAANRVYWAIRTLRELGLRDVVVTLGDGYCIDPECTVIRQDPSSSK